MKQNIHAQPVIILQRGISMEMVSASIPLCQIVIYLPIMAGQYLMAKIALVGRKGDEMSKPKIYKLTAAKNIPIGDEIIPKGSTVDAIVTLGCYKIFHHTGWWLCKAEWFEEVEV